MTTGQPGAGHPVALFHDGTGGEIFDFTDHSRIAAPPKAPLLPPSGAWVLGWAHRTDSTTTNMPVIWQQSAGAVGRTQINANATYNGSINAGKVGRLNVFMAGVTDGAGVNGMIAPAPHAVGTWADFVLIVRAGAKASEFWRDGVLIDRFTAPASWPQVRASLCNIGAASDRAGQTLGRVICLHRAPVADEMSMIRAWLRESFSPPAAPWARGLETTLTARAAILWWQDGHGGPGMQLWGRNVTAPLPPGSMTKLMTAATGLKWLRALDAMKTSFERLPTDTASARSSGSNLDVGDILDVDGALANMGLPSSNITANLWARRIGELILASEAAAGKGTARFVRAMNDYARELGMSGSHWVNPSGLDAPGHLSTAMDLALLCSHVSRNEPGLAQIWSNASWQLAIQGPNPRTLRIAHSVKFIASGDRRVVWGKTGTTPSGNSLLGEVDLPGGGRCFYVGIGSSTDADRYADANAVFGNSCTIAGLVSAIRYAGVRNAQG